MNYGGTDMAEKRAATSTTIYAEGLELIMEGIFNAPCELVWEGWTKPEYVARWWGPSGYAMSVCEIDLRKGGSYRFVQRGPDGNDYPFKGMYREIVKPKLLTYTQIFDMEPYSSQEAVVIVKFEKLEGGKTKLTSRMQFATIEELEAALATGMEAGATESMERLAELLAKL
jgi:uncharacterized protein YndB with AHSA1/START domain